MPGLFPIGELLPPAATVPCVGDMALNLVPPAWILAASVSTHVPPSADSWCGYSSLWLGRVDLKGPQMGSQVHRQLGSAFIG